MEEIQQTPPKPNIISTIANVIDRFLIWVSVAIGVALTFNMIIAVAFRYVLNNPIFWADELSLYLFCWITFLGACLGVKRSDMAAVTILIDRLSPKLRLITDIFIQLSTLLFASIIGYYSILWVKSPSVVNQVSATIPINLWILYSVVPIAMLCIIIFTIDHINKLVQAYIFRARRDAK
ncbi:MULTISPECIES: TRAP transporter small permease [unclassified Paenibacillus]|uniref:TRAP transporter small permease n=1 Tax=unclassified Paenibacillus TaxID=185978 RepID=UPI001AEACDDE|nr:MULTISPECIES: TRAP transporter small permease [unclassified Paenibacillus]MBP1157270.1 C4-dicarboxylate transporter DctQ subunit [Paenibacillus sp. PvP091]MBP1171991.1 C4-dicarboxylate transporter DctQ subunit [Paenibacillus sp. PvR098]MBP2438372.1 C4-dicarboxylate transporter DctQ subunit [Paenibacillus sp. PvP052]